MSITTLVFVSALAVMCLLPQCADAAADATLEHHATLFQEFVKHHNRTYTGAEFDQRFSVFHANVNAQTAHNADPKSTWSQGINQFTDWTQHEFREWMKSQRQITPSARSRDVAAFVRPVRWASAAAAPAHVDLRYNNRVTSVKSVGQLGLGWSFAVIASIESLHAAETGQLEDLSPQQLWDCAASSDGSGNPEDAFEYVRKHGISTLADYPFSLDRSQRVCDNSKQAAAQIYSAVKLQSAHEIADAIANLQVVYVSVDSSSIAFQNYVSGIITEASCGGDLEHGIAIVGYGRDEVTQVDYWIAKNSWGPNWGANGYVYIQRGVNRCGCETEAIIPTA